MSWLEAIILGVIQGLTEFLPVSSSGHLEIVNALFGLHGEENVEFVVAVHGATVLSTIVVFWREILSILKDVLRWEMNDGTRFVINVAVSMVPIFVVGVMFREQVEGLFVGDMRFVGAMLMITACLLALSYYLPRGDKEMNPWRAFVVGVMQAVAVIPGISRSGATISSGLILGVKADQMAKFSFLMVLVPILGANLLDAVSYFGAVEVGQSSSLGVVGIGALSAFVSGVLACRWMVGIVRRGKLIWFALYCLVVGVGVVIYSYC